MKLFCKTGIYASETLSNRTIIMHVQVIHEAADGSRTDFGFQELAHMPPIGEPFPVDNQTYYTAKAYLGPDENNIYLLILEGTPKLVE